MKIDWLAKLVDNKELDFSNLFGAKITNKG